MVKDEVIDVRMGNKDKVMATKDKETVTEGTVTVIHMVTAHISIEIVRHRVPTIKTRQPLRI